MGIKAKLPGMENNKCQTLALAIALIAATVIVLAAAPARADDDDPIRLRPATFPEIWEVHPEVLEEAEAAATPQEREKLVPVLDAANAHQAAGYDRLRAVVCAEGTFSIERARACSDLPIRAEERWRRNEKVAHWMARAGATALYAGAVTATFVEPDRQSSRVIATASGVPIGATLGTFIAWMSATPSIRRHRTPTGLDSTGEAIKVGAGLAGALVGGAVGGFLAHEKAASPDARGPLTAMALAPAYLMTLMLTIDDCESFSVLCFIAVM
jgi:hypothetical protein